MKSTDHPRTTYQHYASLSGSAHQVQPDTYQPQHSSSSSTPDLMQELNESSRLRRLHQLNQSYLQGLDQLQNRPDPSESIITSNSESQPTHITPPRSFNQSLLSSQRAKKASLHQSKLIAPLNAPPRLL